MLNVLAAPSRAGANQVVSSFPQRQTCISCGWQAWGAASGSSSPIPFLLPYLRFSAAAVVAWVVPTQAALPQYACRGINRRTHTDALLRITQNMGKYWTELSAVMVGIDATEAREV